MGCFLQRIFLLCITGCVCFMFVAYYKLQPAMLPECYTAPLPVCRPLCSQADVDKRPNTVVLTTTNMGFLKMTENMLESIQRTRSCPYTVVVAEDEWSYKCLKRRAGCYRGLHVKKTDSGPTTSEKLRVGSRTYNQFVRKRARYTLQYLESGLEVLFVDVDTFWVKDPFGDFKGDFDIAAHNEVDPPREPVFCCGFTYYRPTAGTIRLVKEWIELLNTKDRYTPDQRVFNRLVNREVGKNDSSLTMRTLNPVNYPDGSLYYSGRGWREAHFDQTTVMHFSYLYGYDAKVKKLKELGWWLV